MVWKPVTPYIANSTSPFCDQEHQDGNRTEGLDAPLNLIAAPADTVLNCSWSSVTGATSYDIRIDGGAWNNTTNLNYQFTSLTNGTPYFIECRAYNGVQYSDISSTNGTPSTIAFPLATGQFVAAKMPMHTIYPRPNTETDTDARHRWISTEFDYEIPIGVQGGAWPFKYEIITAPTGTTVGEYYTDLDYGVLKLDASALSGSQSFTVRVTDQELNTVDLSWTAMVDDTKFVYIQDGYAGTQVGTKAQPLEDFSDWYLNDVSDNTYAGRIVVMRGGNYLMDGDGAWVSGEFVNNVDLSGGNKTKAFIGYPGEAPIVDCVYSKVVTGSGSDGQDVFVAGIEWYNARPDSDNSHFFWMQGECSRSSFWNNTFDTLSQGLIGNDNNAAIFWVHSATKKENLLVKSNTFENINNVTGGNGGYIDMYFTDYILVESNTAKNSATGYGFWIKAVNAFITVRDNVAVDNVSGDQIQMTMGNASETIPHDQEVCYNRLMVTEGDITCFLWAASNGWQDSHYNTFMYRNSIVNGRPTLRFVGATNYELDNNLIIGDNVDTFYDPFGTVIADAVGDILFDSDVITVSDIVDNEAKMVGATRTANLGTAGSEFITPRGY